jgi:Primase C terminal 2 (PriCT-2)/Family of unknown function (DUF5906)/Bifunctional DNA primase/polymerase, N-terminal
MADRYIQRDFLKIHGLALIDQGYTVVPIQQGKKAPGFDGWQKAKASKDQVNEWLGNGFRQAGVGITTKITCAIDIDCRDEPSALKFEQWCLENIGTAPVRIGMAPKRLLLYRTTEPFSKRSSDAYVDEWGDKQQIEILGNGQQFVAFHIHPDTGKPYVWVNDVSPLNVRATDLIELKTEQIDSLIEAFEAHAKEQGWVLAKKGRTSARGQVASDAENPWLEDSSPIEISDTELRNRLMLVTGAEHYDTWFQVGMALYHQYDGDEVGFELWNEWSETADNYDRDSLDRHWKTFSVEGKKRAPLTARFIMRLSKEAVERTAIELSVKLRDAFVNAKDLPEWEKARQLAREAEIDGLARSALAAVAKERRDAITGTKTPIGEIKRAISFLPKKNEKTPTWAEEWVYDVSDDRFLHTERKITATKQGFDAMYDRYAMTKKDILDGKTGPSQSAADLALNLYRIPTVDGRRYMPGRDSIFHEPDGTFANTYPEHEIPLKPEKVLPRDKKNIERVKAHIAHLVANEREQRMLLDWLSWVVQNPGKHVNYAVLLQGVEGDGKSFFAELMRAVMGVSNVTMLNAHSVVNSTFTDWAYGQCLACLEEVRIVGTKGRDKWEAVNKIKPFITNNVVEIHPKGRAVMNVTNTTSYMLFSNYKDALPLDENSRRYLVLFSKWQRKEDIRDFKSENPSYYERLYTTLNESPGALRQWLLEHEQEASFNPRGDAPDTSALKVMINKSKPEFIQVLDQVIEEDETLEASRDLVDVTGLSDAMMAKGTEWPSPKTLANLMERSGYEHLGRVKISTEVGYHHFYSRNPDLFRSCGESSGWYVDTAKVRAYVKQRADKLSDDL